MNSTRYLPIILTFSTIKQFHLKNTNFYFQVFYVVTFFCIQVFSFETHIRGLGIIRGFRKNRYVIRHFRRRPSWI